MKTNRPVLAECRTQRGSAALSMLVIVSLLLMGNSLTLTTLNQQRMQNRVDGGTTALLAAEAGVQRALWEMKYNSGAFTGWSNVTAGSCGTTKTACRLSAYAIPGSDGATLETANILVENIDTNMPRVTSIGTTANKQGVGVQTGVTVTLQRSEAAGRFLYALQGNGQVTVSLSATTNSYNSALGSYAAQTPANRANMATNSTSSSAIQIVWNAIVNGNASIGPSGDPNTGILVGSGGVLNGSRGVLTASTTFVATNPFSACGGSLTPLIIEEGSQIVLPPGDRCYSYVDISGPTAKLSTSGAVRLYVRDYFAIENGARVESNGGQSIRPENLQIFMGGGTGPSRAFTSSAFTDHPCTGGAFCLGSGSSLPGSQVTAVVYSPDKPVNMGGLGQGTGTTFYGAVIAQQINLVDTQLHYDERLATLDIAGIPTNASSSGVTVTSWSQWQP